MARKAKEEVLEKKQPIKEENELKKASKAKATSKAKPSKSTGTTKTKATATKKISSSKSATAKKTSASSTTTKKTTAKKPTTTEKKLTTKKTSTSSKTTAKATAKKSATTAKKVATKKASTSSKSTTKKNTTKKTTTAKKSTAKKATARKTTTKKSTTKNVTKKASLNTIEYYDLPYRYNQTIIKVLAQNPNTLFVYWDISNTDMENFEKEYGSDFFNNTRPVLVVHNLTDNYTFEIDINDFANNWYINVNDTKCKYYVELGRRAKNSDVINKPINYLNISFSNTIEIPNDHILFFKENDKIYFKNIKTNKITEKVIKPYIESLKGIYRTVNLSENNDRFDFQNPSSQTLTSLSSKKGTFFNE